MVFSQPDFLRSLGLLLTVGAASACAPPLGGPTEPADLMQRPRERLPGLPTFTVLEAPYCGGTPCPEDTGNASAEAGSGQVCYVLPETPVPRKWAEAAVVAYTLVVITGEGFAPIVKLVPLKLLWTTQDPTDGCFVAQWKTKVGDSLEVSRCFSGESYVDNAEAWWVEHKSPTDRTGDKRLDVKTSKVIASGQLLADALETAGTNVSEIDSRLLHPWRVEQLRLMPPRQRPCTEVERLGPERNEESIHVCVEDSTTSTYEAAWTKAVWTQYKVGMWTTLQAGRMKSDNPTFKGDVRPSSVSAYWSGGADLTPPSGTVKTESGEVRYTVKAWPRDVYATSLWLIEDAGGQRVATVQPSDDSWSVWLIADNQGQGIARVESSDGTIEVYQPHRIPSDVLTLILANTALHPDIRPRQ